MKLELTEDRVLNYTRDGRRWRQLCRLPKGVGYRRCSRFKGRVAKTLYDIKHNEAKVIDG